MGSDILLSAAPIESHVGAIVVCLDVPRVPRDAGQDSPNACVTLAIPTGIFEQVGLLYIGFVC